MTIPKKAIEELSDMLKAERTEIGACPVVTTKQNEIGAYYTICPIPDLVECDFKGEKIKNNGDKFVVCEYIITEGYLLEA